MTSDEPVLKPTPSDDEFLATIDQGPLALRPLIDAWPGAAEEAAARAERKRAEEVEAERMRALTNAEKVREAEEVAERERPVKVAQGLARKRVEAEVREAYEVERSQQMAPEPNYVDVGAILDDGVKRPTPSLVLRRDGIGLVYPGKDTGLIGDPESGKTLLCAHGVAQVLRDGGNAAWIDVDHNGADSTVARLLDFGVPTDVLRDQRRFRLQVAEAAPDLLAVVKDLTLWSPTLVVLDSIGEVVALFEGASSLDADDFRRVHRAVVKPMTDAGVGVLFVDHPPKGADAAAYGAAGTLAKKSTVDGALLRVVPFEPFVRGSGGAARVLIVKDRHGGLREHCPPALKGEQVACLFRIQSGWPLEAELWAPKHSDQPTPPLVDDQLERDVRKLEAATETERNAVHKVKALLRCGQDRATRALEAYHERHG